MKIVLVISMIGPGGAELVLVTMSNELVKSHEVSIVTFCTSQDEVFYKIDGRINVCYLDLLKVSNGPIEGIRENLRRVKTLRKTVTSLSPDVIVSFLPESNVLVLLGCLRLGVPIVVTEHTDPLGTKIGKPWEALRWFTYRHADVIVVLNQSIKSYFSSRFSVPVIEIPNPVSIPAIDELEEGYDINKPYLITIGRQIESKKIQDVIYGFKKISESFKDWKLVIVGDGPLRNDLEKIKDDSGIGNRIVFTGLVESPGTLLKHAKIFVSASITEAFPMAICEAMASGLPVVVREYDKSVRDIVTDNVSGIIVEDSSVESLAAAMASLMGDEDKRNSLGISARKAMQKFTPSVVVKQWLDLFDNVASR